MGKMNGLESARQTLSHALLHEQWCRTEQDDVHIAPLMPIRIPQPLDHFRPIWDLLNLVDRQNEARI